MSKFNATSISEPMSFLYLDLLANSLLDESKELESEFNTKLEFVREQEKICVENANDLIEVDKCMDQLKNCVYKFEMELHENECSIAEAENRIQSAEYWCHINEPINNVIMHSDYLELLKLLVSAECSARKCNMARRDVEEFNEEADKRLGPSRAITLIMDYYNQALCQLEEQVNAMQGKADEVKRIYDEVIKKMKIRSLGAKFLCKTSKEFERTY